ADHRERRTEAHVHEPRPLAHAPELPRIAGTKRRSVEHLVDVLEHGSRFGEHPPIVHERRHRPVRIDSEESGRVLLALCEIEVVIGELDAFFREREQRLARIHVRLPGVDVEHGTFLMQNARSYTRWIARLTVVWSVPALSARSLRVCEGDR